MENLALIESFSEFKDEKLIDRVTLMVILEEVFRNTLKRKFGADENFDIIINTDKGDFEIWRNREVVEDDDVVDPGFQIGLSEAKTIDDDYEVGEEVTDEVTGVIHSITDRKNYIIRKSIHKTGHGHIIAANIDQVIIIATLAFPRTSLGFIDRLTVAAESFRIPVTIIFNKMDTLEDEGIAFPPTNGKIPESPRGAQS